MSSFRRVCVRHSGINLTGANRSRLHFKLHSASWDIFILHLRSLNSEQCPLFFTQPTFLKKVGQKWEISESWRVLMNRWKHVCTDRKQTWADRNQSVMFRPDQKHLKSYQSVWTSILQILKLRLDVPPTGMRSLPVVKWSSFFCSSSGNASTTSQKNLLPPTQAQNTQIHTQTSCLWNGCTQLFIYVPSMKKWHQKERHKVK